MCVCGKSHIQELPVLIFTSIDESQIIALRSQDNLERHKITYGLFLVSC